MASNLDLAAALRRDAKRTGLAVGIGAGFALILLAAFLVYLGVTWEEPAMRASTRSVPAFAPIAISIVGGVVALAGLRLIVRAFRR